MIVARLMAIGDEREHGTWEFVSLPVEGSLIGIRINDEPVIFCVRKLFMSQRCCLLMDQVKRRS